jgi:hypothetical protein
MRRHAMRQRFKGHMVYRNPLLAAVVLAAIAMAIGTPGGKNSPDASLAGGRESRAASGPS